MENDASQHTLSCFWFRGVGGNRVVWALLFFKQFAFGKLFQSGLKGISHFPIYSSCSSAQVITLIPPHIFLDLNISLYFHVFFPFIDQTRTSCILTSFMIASSWLSDWNPIICFVLFCLTSAWIVPWPEGQFQSHGDLWELGPPLNARASHPFLPYHETNGSFRSLSPVWVLQMLCHSYFCYENVPSPGNKKNILK